LIIRCLLVPLTVAVVLGHAGQGFAQSAFPAPLQGQNAPSSASPSQAGPSDECRKQFVPLREEAEQRGALIKAASNRHAPPEEACKLIGSFGQSEIKMIKYVETNASKCGAQIADQLKNSHKNTEAMQKKVCTMAQQQQRGPAGPLGDWILREDQL
jgi:hypothetical protein